MEADLELNTCRKLCFHSFSCDIKANSNRLAHQYTVLPALA